MAFVTGVKCPVKYNSMRVDVLDPLVWAEVTALCTRPAVLVAMLSRSDAALAGQQEDTLAALQTAETVLQEAHDRLTGLIEQSAVSGQPEAVRDALAVKMEEQTTIITKMEARKMTILEQQAAQHVEAERVQEVVDWIRTVGESLESFTYEQRRRLLYALGVRAVVTRGEDGVTRYQCVTDFEGLNLGVVATTADADQAAGANSDRGDSCSEK
jgi:hypothetical protein